MYDCHSNGSIFWKRLLIYCYSQVWLLYRKQLYYRGFPVIYCTHKRFIARNRLEMSLRASKHRDIHIEESRNKCQLIEDLSHALSTHLAYAELKILYHLCRNQGLRLCLPWRDYSAVLFP